ncbi:serine recombinase [Heyndrickxia sporothermodurans]|nr:serine recombinase [Heyndrickxia sporothermodurans]
MKVYIYLRKSRKDIEEEKKRGNDYDTLNRHRKALLSLIKQKKFDLAMEPFEEIVSGESVLERPQMQKLLKLVESGSVDAVVVMDLDRLGRGDMLDQGLIDRAFRYSGTLLITPTEIYDPTSEEWELIFGIKSLVARGELKAITRRLQGGRKASVKEGKSISKKPPYGYTRDDKLKLHPDENTSWVIKKIFDMVADGKGRQAVSNELDRLGVKPPDEKRDYWSPSMVTAIIKNEVYKGDLVWGKFKYTKRHGKYQRKRVDPQDWIIHENAHDSIVSDELWELANKAHSGRHRAPSYNLDKKLSNPLAGVLVCALCNRSMMNLPRPNRRSSMLRCTNPACKGKQKSSYLDIVETKLINNLYSMVKMKLNSPVEEIESIIPIQEKVIERKNKELKELHIQKNNLHDFLEKGVYTIETFLERQNILLEKINNTESTIKQLQVEIEKEKMKHKNTYEYIPLVRKVLEAYHHTDDVEKRNRLLKSVLEKATYLRKKEWKEPDHFEIQLYPNF